MKTTVRILIAVLCGLGCSCNQEQQDHQEVMAQVDLMQIPPPKVQEMLISPEQEADRDLQQPAETKVPTERKIIKNGTIRFDTKDAKETQAYIAKSVAEYKGFIVLESSNDQNYQIEYRTTVQIPADKFEEFLTVISTQVDNLRSKDISAEDVTAEYVDVESRIKTKKELEARYQQLLQKATKVEEMLAIEREMGTLRTDIESIEGRLRYLKDRVAFSTLTIIYYETPPASLGFLGKLGIGLADGWNNLLEFLVAVVSLWPFWLLIAGFIFLLLRYRRRKVAKA
ncbi:DUF4349 domain-containing protein [Salmonirosea aquatica]|uniref:DUF4349 domain-containing protein n=1 Tax=Salmonirosea aquatica TaxID=2654236 RepID=A0A7C9BDU0_9BACT|nr:DUF4349 domain-containing protein [Cytophagaceae bacterium SJW1-29]